jgi:hypothetical protein
MSRLALIAFAAAAGLAGAAQAESASDALRAAVLAPKAAISRPGDAPNAKVTLNSAYAEAYNMRVAGIAKTSVESRLAENDDVTGALGFLCGLQPGQKPTGAAAARGYDPSGRFIGAKLSFALK